MQGVIVNGAVRDSAAIAKLPFGCKALGTTPRKSEKKTPGTRGLDKRYMAHTDSRWGILGRVWGLSRDVKLYDTRIQANFSVTDVGF